MTSSGRMHDSSIGMPSRTFRYSGSDRPACRMNHTGVCGTGSRLHALRKAELYVAVGWWPEGLALALTRQSLARPLDSEVRGCGQAETTGDPMLSATAPGGRPGPRSLSAIRQ
ncbi:hypothetical protein GCM10017771_02820 [Streptomyces capitiformicae]|uniref:Uncharacterized protein n=1 Tax=Streptomyces capitiformicae TaxID=2014920 RepID=A0A919L2A7_9ACTN|nr:hypothetical protein GCM10017771_02820 [Streptomyces capitiformicae]